MRVVIIICMRLPEAVLLVALLASCGGGAAPTAQKKALTVATDIYPVEFLVQRIGGDVVEVRNLTPPGTEPHDLELKPSDVRLLHTADLVLVVVNDLQPAVARALRDRYNAYQLGAPYENGGDPHLWLSPPLMVKMAGTVLNTIATNRQQDASELRARYETLKQELQTLDREFKTKLRVCARREIFTSHAAFGYLAKEYGLRQIAITGIDPEAEPSPKRLQEIARQARDAGATTIFFETLVSPRVSESVARIVGGKTALLDPVESVTSKADDYFSVMRRNLAALAGALGCAS
jgi:zinc transport system substrate-binding protein